MEREKHLEHLDKNTRDIGRRRSRGTRPVPPAETGEPQPMERSAEHPRQPEGSRSP